ncbi:MAG: hypothetical protein A3I72_10975 [Candidatus Tectomicrobia bacterium RIFCSPLOWO2_02_FULL_70_19]|nr:MAG: hypothetical protein A3I72_10975 [Candidatus Tectomicrobia bacterium RIFCSPLOWO2_02_FULL_70_19]
MRVAAPLPAPRVAAAWGSTTPKSSEPKRPKMRKRAIRKQKSPTRFTTKAFLPASAAESRSCQKPMRR